MLYVILANGTFVTVVEGRSDEPIHDHLRAYDTFFTNLTLQEYLSRYHGYDSVRFAEVETIKSEQEPRGRDCSLYIILDDCELWDIVRGRPNAPIYRFIQEFDSLDVHDGLEEFLIAQKGMQAVDVRVVDTIDVLGPTRFAHLSRFERLFTN